MAWRELELLPGLFYLLHSLSSTSAKTFFNEVHSPFRTSLIAACLREMISLYLKRATAGAGSVKGRRLSWPWIVSVAGEGLGAASDPTAPVRQTTCTSPLDRFCRKGEGGSREGGVGGGTFERIERETGRGGSAANAEATERDGEDSLFGEVMRRLAGQGQVERWGRCDGRCRTSEIWWR